jgi:hypothetical protein
MLGLTSTVLAILCISVGLCAGWLLGLICGIRVCRLNHPKPKGRIDWTVGPIVNRQKKET